MVIVIILKKIFFVHLIQVDFPEWFMATTHYTIFTEGNGGGNGWGDAGSKDCLFCRET